MAQTELFKITEMDFEVLKRLRAWLNIEKKRVFTADDLYRLKLVQHLPEPHNHTVGAWFAKMQQAGEIESTGEHVPSKRSTNNRRMIKVYDAFPKEGS